MFSPLQGSFLLGSREGPRKKKNHRGCCGPLLFSQARAAYSWQDTATREKRVRVGAKEEKQRKPSSCPSSAQQAAPTGQPIPTKEQTSRLERAGASPHSLLPTDLGLLHGPQIGVIDDALLAIPAAGQGGVLLHYRSVRSLSSGIVGANMKSIPSAVSPAWREARP